MHLQKHLSARRFSWNTFRTLLPAMLFVALFSGCGVYSGSSGRVDENIKKVAVQYLENLTPEPNLGVEMSQIIIFALQRDNTLKVVDEANADSIISGRVVRYALKELATTERLTVDEYQVQIAVVLNFTVRSTGEKIFENRRFTGTGNYYLDGTNNTNEDTARNEAVEEIVRDILAQVVEDW